MSKKLAVILLSLALALSVAINSFAASVPNRVYSDPVSVEAGRQVTIPVKIENNDGFMGFAIIVTYDAEALTPVSVSKGEILAGMFNDSIETATDNSFKVVFSGTGNITADGVLFNIVFNTANDTSGKYDIKLSYSQQDTFKENWNDAVLNCEKIETVITVNGTTAAPDPTEPSTTEPTEPSEPSTEPSTDPSDSRKPLSVRMREWVKGLPVPFNFILGIFVIPVAFIVSIFE
ncbi:MAG: cohesin domain-containing protein [Acutalibacteraceae bacterium]